jgi:hypothetical protein
VIKDYISGYRTSYACKSRGLGVCLIHLQDKFGFCFVSEVPATPEATEELCQRIGFIRETQCMFSVPAPFLLELNARRWEVLGIYC